MAATNCFILTSNQFHHDSNFETLNVLCLKAFSITSSHACTSFVAITAPREQRTRTAYPCRRRGTGSPHAGGHVAHLKTALSTDAQESRSFGARAVLDVGRPARRLAQATERPRACHRHDRLARPETTAPSGRPPRQHRRRVAHPRMPVHKSAPRRGAVVGVVAMSLVSKKQINANLNE